MSESDQRLVRDLLNGKHIASILCRIQSKKSSQEIGSRPQEQCSTCLKIATSLWNSDQLYEKRKYSQGSLKKS